MSAARQTRLFTAAWNSCKLTHLPMEERQQEIEVQGVVFGRTGLVALDNGATYDNLQELRAHLKWQGTYRISFLNPFIRVLGRFSRPLTA